MIRRWLRVAVALAFGAALMFAAAPTPAMAVDDYLEASDPARHQELDQEPGWVTLAFASKANAELAKIIVMDSAGKNVTVGALIVEGTNVTTQLKGGLPKGTYTVMYRTSGRDGRMRGGSFQFAYGKGTWTTEEKEVWIGPEEEPTEISNPDPNPGTPIAEPSIPTAEPTAAASEPATPQTGPGVTGWLIGGGVVALLAAGGAVTGYVLRRRGSGG